jgi:hypothetical protein
MNRQKMAAFLADCLGHMPDQPEQLQCVVDTVIAVLTRIANGGEWSEGEARAVTWATDWAAANRAATWAAAIRAVTWATDWAAARAAWAAAARAAYWAAEAHPDPAKERARQAKVREDLGL